jgi:hypothetical protein
MLIDGGDSMRFLRFSGVLLIIFGASVYADVKCVGDVDDIAIRSNGELRITAGFHAEAEFFTVCNIETALWGIDPKVCSAWLSQVQAASTSGKDISVFYPDGTDCSSFPTGIFAPTPKWMILN